MICAIIPARGGSKGIPRKNLIPFCGKPLIAWSIDAAVNSRQVDKVFVSSDDEEILSVSERFGAERIMRPAEISTDTSSTEEALIHSLDYVEKSCGKTIDYAVLLQATSPLRTAEDIDSAIESLQSEGCDSLFSAAPLDDYCIWGRKDGTGELYSMSYDYKNRGRRQERKPLYLENGSIYVYKPGILRTYRNRLGGKIGMYPMDYWKSYEIDKSDDIELCEYFMREKILKKP